MQIKFFNIILFSTDLAFIEIIKRLFERCSGKYYITVLTTFSDASFIIDSGKLDLIIIDDIIIGTSSLELISYLRLRKNIVSPIFYFGVSEFDGERKALTTGANHFFNKPFNPDIVVDAIQKTV